MQENLELARQALAAVVELTERAELGPGDLLVIGCSTSEVLGERIGTHSSYEAAEAIAGAILPYLAEQGIFLAAQCCEHLNRALILEGQVAARNGWDEVNVVPVPKAGGSFAAAVYAGMKHPVAVEHIRAHAGLDIGGTLIGMHLREVAVPIRLEQSSVGAARLLAARTRPKYIGGPRAKYDESKM